MRETPPTVSNRPHRARAKGRVADKPAAMASAASTQKMQEEATCSICLEHLTEPVTIDCGHNFCRACITQHCEHREPERGTKFPCPQCLALFQKEKLRPNTQQTRGSPRL
uniref:RING-type domain-containing protein n=1 Tax=Pelusios castaneus TaxID=367368 RepID=A0A8C8RIS7_9SAUR